MWAVGEEYWLRITGFVCNLRMMFDYAVSFIINKQMTQANYRKRFLYVVD